MAAGTLALTVMIQGQNLLTGMIRDIGSQFGILGAGLATVGVAAVGVGIESTKMAGDFQTSLLSLVAHAGLAKSQFDTVSQSVLAMSTAVGRSPTQLAEALYPILSAFSGIQNQSAKSAIALDTLKMSFETVAGTTVDGTAVANAAVGTFNALGLATNNVSTNTARMTGLFDVMDKTVQLGNMQWDAYKNVVSKLAVAIQGTGITFNESQAALATMTNEGFSAQRASTYLSNTFTTLAIKTDALAKHAKSLGISFDESKYGPMSLADKIQYLNQITDGNKQKLLALMGNNSTALKTFNALSVGVGAYKSNLDALNHAQGTLAGSFATASQGFDFQMQQLKAAGDALMITIGTALLPVAAKLLAQITPLITKFSAWVTTSGVLTQVASGLSTAIAVLPGIIGNIVGFFGNLVAIGAQVVSFFQQNQWAVGLLMVALGALAGVMSLFAVSAVADMILSMLEFALSLATTTAGAVSSAAIMITTFGTMSSMIVTSMGAAAASTMAIIGPFLLVGAIIAAVVVGIVLVVQHWGQIAPWLLGMWGKVQSFFTGVLGAIKGAIAGMMTWWNQWGGIIKVVGGIILTFFAPALIQAGVQAGIAGAKIAASFVQSMVQTGAAAVASGAKTSASFVVSMVQSGAAAVVSAAKVTGSFLVSMVQTGIQAVISAAKVTGSFIASMVMTGAQAWIAGAKVVAGFIGPLIAAGTQAVLTGAKFVAGLIPAIVSFGVTAVTTAAAAIPPMIAGFIAWAAGAWAAAAATIAATWPILLIIAAIALLVVGIILLVTHWGQVTDFLKTTWQRFTSWFMEALASIGHFFSNIWNGITDFFQNTVFPALATIAKVGMAVLLVVITGPLGLLVVLFMGPLNGLWQQIQQWFGNLVNGARGWLNTIVQLFQNLANMVKNIVGGMVQNVVGFFQNMWNVLVGHSIVPAMNGAIMSSFSNMSQNVTSTTATMSTSVQSNFNSMSANGVNSIQTLSSSAQQLLQQMAGGMDNTMAGLDSSMAGYFNDVASYVDRMNALQQQAAANVRQTGSNTQGSYGGSTIGHHATGILNSPTGHFAWVGEYGRELMFVPKGASIFNQSQLASAFALGNAGVGNAFALGGGSQTIVVQVHPGTINLDGKRVGESVSQYQVAQVRRQGGWRNS